MTVTDVLEYLAGGITHEELLAEFPDLTEEDVRAYLSFAADRERKLATLPARSYSSTKTLSPLNRIRGPSSAAIQTGGYEVNQVLLGTEPPLRGVLRKSKSSLS